MFRGRVKKVHFVGIGGSGMSGIAEVLLNMGYKVSGSDLGESKVTERLKSLGVEVFCGHSAGNVRNVDCLVYSSAVAKDNPELKEARKAQVPIIPRAEMLAELMRLKYAVAVAGTHGKTTTTSMIGSIMGVSGMDPTIVTGGRLNSIGANALLGTGEFLVAEADESDGSFLKLTPTIAVVTGIDREHMDHYRDFEDVIGSFLDFINKVPFYGCAVLNMDHPALQGLLPAITRRHVTYGFSKQARVQARHLEQSSGRASFELRNNGKSLGRVSLPMPGEHNVSNALAASAVALELGVKAGDIKEGLESFPGVERRFELKGELGGIMVVDDYGHHPIEVKAVLRAVKQGWKRRAVVVFQPHRYSRTKDLFEDFTTAFNDADVLILTDIYPAGERPLKGVSSKALYRAIKERGHGGVEFVKDLSSVGERLEEVTSPGDMVLTLGAGDVYRAGEDLLRRLKNKGAGGGFKVVGRE